ncbi:class I SAM-dependent methyltransferase [Oryzifoliimicrobium ureilyticus]|uniref:class I SAM-dependent methyltransferase n=1 Tax=Oryzifoliimicrobium ureilyticus TaxID=3113724 RepID=UPI00307607BE
MKFRFGRKLINNTDMRSLALKGLDLQKKSVLEIGPLDRPIVQRGMAKEVFYLDHCSTDDLRQKYASEPHVDKSRIAEVDFVSNDGRLTPSLFPRKFDVVVASHVIEHVPNLVGWLADIADVLSSGGHLALVVPDCRFTFDKFRRPTPRHWIAEAHFNDARRPELQNVIDHFSNVAHINANDVWQKKDVTEARRIHSTGDVASAIQQWHAGAYLDCHSWVFTRDTFPSLIDWLTSNYHIPLVLSEISGPVYGQLEFYVQLKRSTTS